MDYSDRTLAVLVFAATPSVKADHVFLIYMDGTQETPPNSSEAYGFGVAILNDDLTELNFIILYDGLEGGNVSGVHFHRGAFGQAGGVVRGYNQAAWPSPGGFVIESWTSSDPQQPLTEALVGAMFDGFVYFNIHTTRFPAGEIRGQLGYFFSY